MKTFCGIFMAGLLSLALAGISAAAADTPKTFIAVLSGECPQAADNWRGVAVFQIENGTVEYKVVVANIDEALIAGHIHFLPPGAEGGPVVQDLNVTAPAEAHGIVAEGTFTNPDVVAGILAGDDYYVNLHTATCLLPLGAVRGAIRVPATGG